VLHRCLQLSLGSLAMLCPLLASGQAAQPPQFFAVCGSQVNLPTIYFSGVLQGPATAFAGFQAGFLAFLQQRYAYAGVVACLPTNKAVNAQNFINARSTALRNAKKIVVDTGWTESAVVAAAPQAAVAAVPAAFAAAAASKPAAAAPGASAGSTSGASQLSGVLGTIFGSAGSSGSSGGSGGGACGGPGASAAKPGASGSSSGCQNSIAQVASTLTSVFGTKSTAGSASAGGGKDGALGGAQWQTTKLVVYGCGRQDMQVACVTELVNQNQKDTLVHAADVWTDAFIVDDRGDRHQRTTGFFLNVDGDQRQQIDVSYGKTARFILMFDGVPAKVQKVALRSATGGLDVEEIGLIVPNAAAQADQPR
jgi:hypothetical protein